VFGSGAVKCFMLYFRARKLSLEAHSQSAWNSYAIWWCLSEVCSKFTLHLKD